MPNKLQYLVVLFLASLASGALNPKSNPGGNFDLSRFTLQLPTGAPKKPDTISSDRLKGPQGWQNPNHFFTNKDNGALVMIVPGSPSSAKCVTTTNSKHCRTELRENTPNSWSPKAGTNCLTAKLEVNYGSSVVVGQIKMDGNVSTKPVAEIYYNSNGEIRVGVQQSRNGSQKSTSIGHVPMNTPWKYELCYQKNSLSFRLNNGLPRTFNTDGLDAPKSYFKVGNYNQGDSPSKVQFHMIDIKH